MDSHSLPSPTRPHAVSSIKEFPKKDYPEENPKSLSDVVGHRPVSSTDTQLSHLKTMDHPTFGALVSDRGKSEYNNSSTYQYENEKIPTVGDVYRIVNSFEDDDDDDEVEYNMCLVPPNYNGLEMVLESSEHEADDVDTDFVEIDPTGRYGRYKEVLGKGAFKKVYKAFDGLEGIEVAWYQIKVSGFRSPEVLEWIYSEVHLLKTLKHKNIIKFYNSWVDTTNKHINFITEIFTSGTLRQYRKKHKHADLGVLKKWSKQILEGLLYLHSHDPPVIHRDLKCDNIFVNGNQGEVKIGDLGLAAILHQAHSAHRVIGTPEFMAPELYKGEYNELVDIYAFGMCLLELVTFEYPYCECANAAQIYKKVTSGVKPASLAKVKNPEVKSFVEKCIAKVADRLSAKELLMDQFLHDEIADGLRRPGPSNSKPDDDADKPGNGKAPAMLDSARDFTVKGQMRDMNTVFLKLQIEDTAGQVRKIHFPFDTDNDTSIAVASEMVEELDLTDQDVDTIAEMIDAEIRLCIPDGHVAPPKKL